MASTRCRDRCSGDRDENGCELFDARSADATKTLLLGKTRCRRVIPELCRWAGFCRGRDRDEEGPGVFFPMTECSFLVRFAPSKLLVRLGSGWVPPGGASGPTICCHGSLTVSRYLGNPTPYSEFLVRPDPDVVEDWPRTARHIV